MITMYKFGTRSWLLEIPVFLSFFTHCFTIERGRNNFSEYDLHYLFALFPFIGIGCLARVWFKRNGLEHVSFNLLDFTVGIFVIYVTIQSVLIITVDYRYMYLCWGFASIYCALKFFSNTLDRLSLIFSFSIFISATFFLYGGQLVSSEFYLANAVNINKGHNATFFASSIPYILNIILIRAKKKILFKYCMLQLSW